MKNKTIDYFVDNKIINMDDLYEFLDILNKENHTYIFRGQSNTNLKDNKIIYKGGFQEWSLDSSLRRELGESLLNSGANDAVSAATVGMLSFISERTSNESQLQILSSIQHYNGATAFVDFSDDIFHALFFAFQNDNFSPFEEGFANIFIKEVDENIEYNFDFKEHRLNMNIIFSCPKNINRGISQKSHFLFDWDGKMAESHKIKKIRIDFSLKNNILSLLRRKNINYKNIFPDKEGLFKEYFEENYLMIYLKGNKLFYNQRYEESILKYEKVINIKDNFIAAWFNWGLSLMRLSLFEAAILKFKKI